MAKRKTATRKQTLKPINQPARNPMIVDDHGYGELPDDVVVVNVPVPIYLGEVSEIEPRAKIGYKLPTPEHRRGINSLVQALSKMNIKEGDPNPITGQPNVITRLAPCARYVYVFVDRAKKAFLEWEKEHSSTPKE